MEQVNFQTVEGQGCQQVGSLHHVGMGFAGQSEDDMDTGFEIALCSYLNGLQEALDRVTAVDSFQGAVVAGLQTVFHQTSNRSV